MEYDDEVERIQRRKLEEMIRRRSTVNHEPPPQSRIPSGIMILSDLTFWQEVKKYRLMVVDFWAPWCGPCRFVSPIIEQLSRDYDGRVAFGKVNVDENPSISSSFGIQGIPTIMFFSRGNAVDSIVGAVPKTVIDSKIRLHLTDGASPYTYHKKRFGETKNPYTVYGWDEFVSPMPKWIEHISITKLRWGTPEANACKRRLRQ